MWLLAGSFDHGAIHCWQKGLASLKSLKLLSFKFCLDRFKIFDIIDESVRNSTNEEERAKIWGTDQMFI